MNHSHVEKVHHHQSVTDCIWKIHTNIFINMIKQRVELKYVFIKETKYPAAIKKQK